MARKPPRRQDLGKPLSARELNRLDEFLSPLPGGGVEWLDGFLAAVLAGPGLIPPSEVLPYVVGTPGAAGQPEIETLAHAEELMGLIMRHWNQVAQRLQAGDYTPVLGEVDGMAKGNEWALGFMQGAALRPQQWKRLLQDQRELAAFQPIAMLAAEGHPDPKLRGPEIDQLTREALLDDQGSVVVGIRRFFSLADEAVESGSPGPDIEIEPPTPADERAAVAPHWEVGWVPIPGRIEEDPDARLVALLIVREDGHIVRLAPQVSPPADPKALASILVAEFETAIGEEGVPAAIWVADQTSATALRRLSALRRVIIELVDRLPVFTRVRADFVREVGQGTGDGSVVAAPTWTGWGLQPDTVAVLFRAAAALVRAGPWRLYRDDEFLSVVWPSGLQWVVSVTGGAGIQRGLMCFTEPEDAGAMVESPNELPRFKGTALALGFGPMDDLSPSMRNDILAGRWEVAAADAFPDIYVVNSPTAGLDQPTAEQLAEVIAALARFATTKRRRRSLTWVDRETGITLARA
jgi:uncharacterized protein